MNGIKDVIKQLEQQRTAIERALNALRDVDGTNAAVVPAGSPATSAAPATRKARRKGGMTSEGRRRLSEALRARWAAKRAATTPVKAKRPGRK